MTLLVGIEKQMIVKPYLGGWRHKISGIEYLNATSQTTPLRKYVSWKNTCSRAVQCMQIRNEVTQSTRHCATQMWRDDCYIPNEADKYMTVEPYKSYMQLRLDLENHARVIQRNYRVYRLMKYVKKNARLYRDMLEKCKRYEKEEAIAYKTRHKRNIFHQIYPRSRTDFDMLYSLIERWRWNRFEDIKSRLFEAAQRAEGYRILEKTVEMFNHIDKHKRAIANLARERRALRFLTLNCEPIRWNGYKGKSIEMVTVKIQKARELKRIYDALSNHDASPEERTDLLITLRDSLKVHRCVGALDTLLLLDQEIALLNRGIKCLSSGYLNERITHTYLNFVYTHGTCGCEVVGENSKNDELRAPLEARTKFCRGCLRLLPHRKFLPHSRTRKLSVCADCSSLSRRNIAPVDYDPYMFILNCVRADEKRQQSASALAFMMQEHDIYHLVDHVWHGRSAVSKINDLFLLRLIRYRKNVEWAPWNCILLTKDEADVHLRIHDPAIVYSKHLIKQINLAHQIAKSYFKQLITFEKNFRESCRFHGIQDEKRYKPPLTLENYDPSRNYQL